MDHGFVPARAKLIDVAAFLDRVERYEIAKDFRCAALREAATRTGRSIAELVRDAVRQVILKPQGAGPVAIWDGEPKRTSVEHDSVYDEP